MPFPCRGQDILQCREPRLPSKNPQGAVRSRHQPGGIPQPSSYLKRRDGASRDLSSGLDNLADAVPFPVPEIECTAIPPPHQVVHRNHMRLRDVINVDVITDAGAVGGFVIRPEDPDMRSEEHTSELQSQSNLVRRLLLDKK